MPESLYPEIRFVGRKKEIERFKSLLQHADRKKWAILLWGEGGAGKTQLLKKFLKIAAQTFLSGNTSPVFSEDSIIDLYWTENRREESLLKNLAIRLDAEGFQEFFTALEAFEQGETSNSEEGAVTLEKLRDAFLVGYKNLEAQDIFLAFDTAERITESVLRFFRGLLHDMQREKPGTLAILAGRPEARQKIENALGESCDAWEVGYLDAQDIEDYLKQEGLKVLEEEGITKVAQLTQGKPIRVALVVDWLKEGNALDDLLSDLDNPKEIDRNLVRRVANVRYPEDWLILYMALLSRRFNGEIARILLPNTPEQSEIYLGRMMRFSFVKYYPPAPYQLEGNWQLHDEMRDLLNLHIWPTEDPTIEIRRKTLTSVIEQYYSIKISQAESALSISLDLKQEWLYYLLQIDFEQAFKLYTELARDAEKNGERTASYFEALNSELAPYTLRMNERQRRVWRVNQVMAGSFMNEKSAHESALETINTENWQTWDTVSQAELRYRLASIYQRSGNQNRLLELCAFEAQVDRPKGGWITWFTSATENNLTVSERLSVLLDYARLLNVVGVVYRGQNRLNNAIACFQESIRICTIARQEPGADLRLVALSIANAQNNLGYAYLRLGRTDEALAECQAALDIRKRFGSPKDMGFSYNVIGTIRVEQLRPEEAESCFRQARNAFESARFESGIGLVLVAHGRLLRQWGEYREISGEPIEKAQEKYQAAEPMFSQAVAIFRRMGDRPNLLEALNEKGTLMRQLRQWEEAAECYNESLKISKSLGNRYREADNECDLGILHFYDRNPEKALKHSERAAQIAEEIPAYYLKAKASQTLAEIYLARKDHDKAFQSATDTASGILRLNPDRFSESAAKRMLEYERVKKWLQEKVIMRLPSQELVNQVVAILIDRWKNEVVETETGKTLVNEFPGFISAMESAQRDYQLLKSPEDMAQ